MTELTRVWIEGGFQPNDEFNKILDELSMIRYNQYIRYSSKPKTWEKYELMFKKRKITWYTNHIQHELTELDKKKFSEYLARERRRK
jgi:hypothetical protein